MNNTLKQLQEKGEEEFDYNFDFGVEDKAVKNFLHQQTTLAFEAGKAEAIAMVLKEIDNIEVQVFDKRISEDIIDIVNNIVKQTKDTLKAKLTAKE